MLDELLLFSLKSVLKQNMEGTRYQLLELQKYLVAWLPMQVGVERV